MLIYSKDFDLNLVDFGILIPLLDERAERCFNELKNHPQLKDSINRWKYSGELEKTSIEDWLRVHDEKFIQRLQSTNESENEVINAYELINKDGSYHRYNPSLAKYPLKQLITNAILHVDGTYTAAKLALKNGFTYFLGGGMHHAMSFEGRGFCILNDMVISLKKLQNEKLIKTAWIIDVDAHKGDGTAQICQNIKEFKTLSIHMKDGWPLDHSDFSRPEFIPSFIDIPIAEDENHFYNEKLSEGLEKLAQSGIPDIAIVVDGSDPYIYDKIPSSDKLKLSLEDLLKRDMLVYNFLKSLKIPQAWVMAGGYGEEVYKVHYQFLEKVLKENYES